MPFESGAFQHIMSDSDSTTKSTFFSHITDKVVGWYNYASSGVWSDPRRNWKLNVLRTVNLSVSSFLNRDIQTQACAMTYRTMLAVVPALALLIAIGRGFGMQGVLKEELFHLFPAQHVAITYAMNFVESYLSQASEGVFVGVGIVFLLYTLISLLGNVEDTFNLIWGQKNGRTIWRKLSDYTATLLILPILMVCASGISLLLSSTLRTIFHFEFMTPIISALLEVAQWFMTFLFFTAAYMLIPNTKVKFKNAFISGTIAGVGFLVLQWLFVTGTLYVTRYNAIYGSLAFLPLMLLWMQLAWVICLAGAVICYSSQNVFAFSLEREVGSISERYRDMVTVAITAIITRAFIERRPAPTAFNIMEEYGIPARLVTGITDRLCAAGLCNHVLLPGNKEVFGFQPAVEPQILTVGYVLGTLYREGTNDFISGFEAEFSGIAPLFNHIKEHLDTDESTPISSIEISKI